MLTVGSLFSGIGGLELGLERTGYFKTVWQVEIDEYARKVLAKHWPDVPKYGDITKLKGEELGYVDLICGGFPCQDISCAGKKAGIHGDRSKLFYEAMRLVRDIRPKYALLENVADLSGRGMGEVLEEIHKSGYNAEWDAIPAVYIGAPHQRDRIFIVAYSKGTKCKGRINPRTRRDRPANCREIMAHSGSGELQGIPDFKREKISATRTCGRNVSDSASTRLERQKSARSIFEGKEGLLAELCTRNREWWSSEPDVGRMAARVPSRVDRLKCLGNSVVPQVAQFIGECIKDFDLAAPEAK